jgi:hypothetical protein
MIESSPLRHKQEEPRQVRANVTNHGRSLN